MPDVSRGERHGQDFRASRFVAPSSVPRRR